jgi:putative SOS response-associated peptidase YedK
MCGRFTLIAGGEPIAELFQLEAVPALTARYNIAPSQPVAVVRQLVPGAPRQLDMVRWGLIPSWSADLSIGNRLINARSETVADKPSFRAAMRQRRCLVPADGFFEWQAQGRKKQPFLFRRRDGGLFAIAELWECWQGPDEKVIESCTLLTTEANEVVRPIHDRMPVLVNPADYSSWLDPGQKKAEPLLPLLRPCPASDLSATEVSSRVNDPRCDGPECIAPVRPPDLFERDSVSAGQ